MENSNRHREKRRVTGFVLILVGLGLFLLRLVGDANEVVVFFVLGAGFLAGYVYRRAYGLLVPCCIFLGLGLGRLGDTLDLGFRNFNAVGLGIGFLAIYVVDRLFGGKSHWWPLIPGVALIAGGAGSGYLSVGRVISTGWPLLLVILGVLILAGVFGRTPPRSGG